MNIYLDGRLIGEVNHPAVDTPAGVIGETTKVTANLFAGSHTVRWYLYGGNNGFNLVFVKFNKLGGTVIGNCADVVNYGFTLTEDLDGNCAVGLEDLALMVDNWLICNNPDLNGCF